MQRITDHNRAMPEDTPCPDTHRPAAAALSMTGSTMSFTAIEVAGREVAGQHDTFEIMAVRSRSIGIGGTFSKANMKITGGVECVELGDAVDASGVQFTDNKAVGVGLSVQSGF